MAGVGDGDGKLGDFKKFSSSSCLSVKTQGGRMTSPTHHLYFFPGDSTNAEAKSLGRSLFGGEASGEAVRLPVAKDELTWRVDALEKAVSPAFDNPCDTRNFYNVYAGDEHNERCGGVTAG